MPAQSILIVDDSRETVRAIRVFLADAGFRVLSAYDGESGMQLIRSEQPDLILLDLMLPDHNGLDITRQLRANSALKAIPIIMLTARVDDTDKVVGLEVGADDYITKPYNPREVVARVRSVLRRAKGDLDAEVERVLTYDELRLDVSRRQLTLRGQEIELTRIEFDLMHALIRSPEHIFTRGELIESALNYQYDGMERSLDTHIKNLRRKLGEDPRNPEYIQTIYGVGYRLGSR
ncbi:MAG: response regulator transcription factor [Anaerolinea sp.]|nr:response regulator transcription factor [Anaerolinea sp.]